MSRILSLDLARGFTVLFIPGVHAFMLYGNVEAHHSFVGKVLTFIAEWPGAQVFMLLMGISFAFSAKRSFREVFVRSMVLIVLGYALNVLKFLIPFWFGGLPESFLRDMGDPGWLSLFLVSDILQFSGVSLMVLWLVQKFTDPVLTALLFMVFVAIVGPSGYPPKVFFPLFPWLVYPLAGFVIGDHLGSSPDQDRYWNDKNKVFAALFFSGAGLMLSSFFAGEYFVITPDPSFYVMGFWSTMKHLGFVLVWLAGWHFVSKAGKNLLFDILGWMSKKITLIYFIQWPLIFWLLPVFGYRGLGVMESLVIGIDISIVVFGVTYLRKNFERGWL